MTYKEGGGLKKLWYKRKIMKELQNIINNIIEICREEQEMYREYLEVESYMNRGGEFSEEAESRFTELRLDLINKRIQKSVKMNELSNNLDDLLERSNLLDMKDSIIDSINKKLHVCENARQGEIIEVKDRMIHESKDIVDQCRIDKEALESEIKNMEDQIDVLIETNKIVDSHCNESDKYKSLESRYNLLIENLKEINSVLINMNNNCNSSKFCRGNIKRNINTLISIKNNIPEISDDIRGAKSLKKKSKKIRKLSRKKLSKKKLSRRR